MENTTQDKRRQILDAAIELFAEHGFEGTSTRMLAKHAGVNIAMISYYFESKENLFHTLVKEKTEFVRGKLQLLNSSNASAFDKINAAIDMYIDRILSNNKFHRIIHRELSLQQRSLINDELIGMLMNNTKEFIKIIKDGIAKGEFRQVDPEFTIVSIYGTVSQAVNSSQLCSYIMGNGKAIDIRDEPFRGRLKNHVKDIINTHLKLQQ